MASRHLSRIAALQALFAADVRSDFSLNTLTSTWEDNTDSLAHDDEDQPFTENLLKGLAAKKDEIDSVIVKSAPQWPIEKIAAIDRNILRLGLFELLYGSTISVPPKVALNEAIELAKTFGGDSSPKFVNGVLGAVYREMGSPRKSESPKKESTQDHAAGAVVCAKEGDNWYVALILDPFGKWTVPKSSINEGELSQTVALRAAEEELGITDVAIIKTIGEHTHKVHKPGEDVRERVVHYYAGVAKKAPLSPEKKEGVKDVQWFAADDIPEDALYEDLRSVIESGIIAAERGEHNGH